MNFSAGAAAATVVLVWTLTATRTEAGPLSTIRGDLCRRLDGRKFYLEVETVAIITAANVTLPEYPRVATRTDPPAEFPKSSRRHRRESLQEMGVPEPRYRRNITVLDSSSLADPSLVTPSEPGPLTTTLQSQGEGDFESLPEESKSPSVQPDPPPPEMVDEEDIQTVEAEVTSSVTQPFKCGAEFFTCPECHLEFTFKEVNLPSCSHDQSCRCDYVRVREPPYMGGGGGRDVCSSGMETPTVFTTQTREGILDFLYTRHYLQAFTVSISAKRNKYHIMGKVNVTQGHIRSPFFPELYPKEHWMEYHLQADQANARIKVNFLDFQLSPWSFVEVQDTNKSRVAAFNGNVFRPPILVSSGPQLTIRFSSNGETARGFNLQYAFVDAESLAVLPAITDCGGFVTNFGGTITMMKMARDDRNYTMYDCVWIVKPPQNYAFKSHLSIRVVQFEDMVAGTRVEVRQGVTSEDYLLEEVGVAGTSGREHVAALDTGFYVRLKGAFSRDSKLAIVYTSFSYLGSCYSLTDFMCHNHRCIPKMLRCDGFDHCGDNSDEPSSCYVGPGNKSLTPEDAAWWYQHTPNYYFPQKNSILLGVPHGWSSLLLLLSLIVLVLVIIGLVSYMFRNGIQDTNRALQRERRAMISRRGSLSDGVEIFDASADDPPLYEPPPDYEEVIKVILSGNNLKLVRRPGGVTAWVPNKLANEGGGGGRQPTNERPLRTRHASLDLERGMEVVLWNPNTFSPARGRTTAPDNAAENPNTLSAQVPLGHFRRSSLPIAPLPEVMEGHVQGHSVSVAPETISEAPEGLDTPRPLPRPSYTLSSPQLSVRSFTYDTSAVSSAMSTPGTSTPLDPRAPMRIRKSKRLLKKGGKKKKRSSTTRKTESQSKEDDSAPPSYEVAMQQASHSETQTPRAVDGPSTSDAASQVNESTQTISDSLQTQELTPTDRLRAARELFQRMSKGEKHEVEESGKRSVVKPPPKRPAVLAQRAKHNRTSSGGTISRGTVKARKAMLLKAQKHGPECRCNGACSCAHFKPEASTGENLHVGGVRAKVHYYSKIEESTKKRESDTSDDAPDVSSEQKELHRLSDDSPDINSSLKKRKLLRNQPVPSLNHARPQRDLDLYFSQNEMAVHPSPVEDMECPLIEPVSSSPNPVIVAAQSDTKNKEASEEKIIPSIRNRVHMYNELAKTPAGSSQTKSPSPVPSPGTEIKENLFLRRESGHSSNEGIDALTYMKNASTCDTTIKPGLVKEKTAKFITAFNQEIRPKLCFQDSDDWSEGGDSPLPIRIPYLNLKNEILNSPDLSDGEKLPIPQLKQEEAESIELWDSRSQGKSEWPMEVETEKVTVDDLPSPASGAVPKRLCLVSVDSVKQPAETSAVKHRGKPIVSKLQDRARERNTQAKSNLKLNLTGKFLPADKTEKDEEEPKILQNTGDSMHLKRVVSEDDLVVMSLATSASPSPTPSMDSLPPSPHHIRKRQSTAGQGRNQLDLNETLNETLDSDLDENAPEERPSMPDQRSSSQTTTESAIDPGSPAPTELKPKLKIPIPSPRGSKAACNASGKAEKGACCASPPAVSGHSTLLNVPETEGEKTTSSGPPQSNSSSLTKASVPSSPPSTSSYTAKAVVPSSPPSTSSATAKAAVPSSPPSTSSSTAKAAVPYSPPSNPSTAKAALPSSPPSNPSKAKAVVPSSLPSTSSSTAKATMLSSPPTSSTSTKAAVPSSPPSTSSSTAKAVVPSSPPSNPSSSTTKASVPSSPPSNPSSTAKAAVPSSPPSNLSSAAKPVPSSPPSNSSTTKASVPSSPESNASSSSSTAEAAGPSSPRPPNQPPTLSPQMVRSGIVTIQTGRNLKWDYI